MSTWRPVAGLALVAAALMAAWPVAAQPTTTAGARVPARPVMPDTASATPGTVDRWLGSDKLRHFVLAGLVQGVAFGSTTTVGVRGRPALVTASALTAVVSVGKEVHDRRRGGRVSGRDLVWDMAGAALYGVLLARSGR